MVRRWNGLLRCLAGVACVAVLTVGTGCGDSSATPTPLGKGAETEKVGDGDPAETGSDDAPDSETPDDESGAPTPPPETHEKSDTGIRATIEHFWASFNYGRSTGDYEPLRALSSPECANCQSYLGSKGRAVEGARWEVDGQILVQTEDDPESGAAEVPMRMTPGLWQPKPGGKTTESKPDNWVFWMELQWKGATWEVARIRLLES